MDIYKTAFYRRPTKDSRDIMYGIFIIFNEMLFKNLHCFEIFKLNLIWIYIFNFLILLIYCCGIFCNVLLFFGGYFYLDYNMFVIYFFSLNFGFLEPSSQRIDYLFELVIEYGSNIFIHFCHVFETTVFVCRLTSLFRFIFCFIYCLFLFDILVLRTERLKVCPLILVWFIYLLPV